MSGLLLAAAGAAGLSCPAMMWWQDRRGRAASCRPAPRGASPRRGGKGELGLDAFSPRPQGQVAPPGELEEAGGAAVGRSDTILGDG